MRKGRNPKLPWLRPDAKSQVTFAYEDDKPVGIDAVVLSTQHAPEVRQKDLREAVMEEIIKPVLPAALARQAHQVPHQPDRPLRDRRAGRRLRPDRPQDHRRHLRRHGPPRRRRVFGQGPVQGRPLGGLRRALCRQEHGRGGPCQPLRNPGVLRDRRRAAHVDFGARPSAPAEFRTRVSKSWSRPTSTCAPLASSRCST